MWSKSFPAVLLLALLAAALRADSQPPSQPGGVIEGIVTYRASADRLWRYARYYVKNGKSGPLAEAVVALQDSRLKNFRPTAEPATVIMDQKDFRFVPETVAIRAGDRVTFTNSDPQLHNVNAASGTRFNINVPTDGAHTETFAQAGGIRRPVWIGCAFHSAMQAWVFVFDHPFFQVTEADGRFRFEDVPPGQYELRMRHPSGALAWERRVTVHPGEVVTMNIEVSPDNLTKDSTP